MSLATANRWMEQFNDLLNCKSTVSSEALNHIPNFPNALGEMPTPNKLGRVKTSIKSHKSLGIDGISSEIVKYEGCDVNQRLLKLCQSLADKVLPMIIQRRLNNLAEHVLREFHCVLDRHHQQLI